MSLQSNRREEGLRRRRVAVAGPRQGLAAKELTFGRERRRVRVLAGRATIFLGSFDSYEPQESFRGEGIELDFRYKSRNRLEAFQWQYISQSTLEASSGPARALWAAR